jgi:formylglycine-generating enzyme required for sulfatase activity
MTLTRNIEQVTSNWSGAAVGSGYIYSGHNDSSPYYALAGDTVNSNGYYLTGQSSGNQRRTLTLTTGEVIWDLSGNIWEWESDTILRKNEPDGYLNSTDAAYTGGWNWEDYNKTSGGTYYLKSSNLGDTTLKYNDLFLLSSNAYNATDNGIGRIYTYSNSADTDTTTYALLRGGCWNTGTDAGVVALTLGSVPGYADASIGLRCVVVP